MRVREKLLFFTKTTKHKLRDSIAVGVSSGGHRVAKHRALHSLALERHRQA